MTTTPTVPLRRSPPPARSPTWRSIRGASRGACASRLLEACRCASAAVVAVARLTPATPGRARRAARASASPVPRRGPRPPSEQRDGRAVRQRGAERARNERPPAQRERRDAAAAPGPQQRLPLLPVELQQRAHAAFAHGDRQHLLAHADEGDALLRPQRHPLHHLQREPAAPAARAPATKRRSDAHARDRSGEARRRSAATSSHEALTVTFGLAGGSETMRVMRTPKCSPEHHHLALGEATVADVDVDRLAGEPIELDHRAAPEAQDLLHRHATCGPARSRRERQVQEHGERHLAGEGVAAPKSMSSGCPGAGERSASEPGPAPVRPRRGPARHRRARRSPSPAAKMSSVVFMVANARRSVG